MCRVSSPNVSKGSTLLMRNAEQFDNAGDTGRNAPVGRPIGEACFAAQHGGKPQEPSE